MNEARIVKNVPSAPAIRAIQNATGELTAGDMITYDQLESIIGDNRKSDRWKTVVSTWRAQLLREDNIMLGNVINTGYVVLDAQGRITASARRYGHGVKRIIRAGVDSKNTSAVELDDTQRKARDHMMRQAGAYVLAEKTAPKKLL